LASRFGAGVFQTVQVFALVTKAQRILRNIRLRQLLIHAGIENCCEAMRRADPHVMTALRTDMPRRFEIAVKNHLATGGALAPQILRRLGPAGHETLDPWADEVGYPVHAFILPWQPAVRHAPNPRVFCRSL